MKKIFLIGLMSVMLFSSNAFCVPFFEQLDYGVFPKHEKGEFSYQFYTSKTGKKGLNSMFMGVLFNVKENKFLKEVNLTLKEAQNVKKLKMFHPFSQKGFNRFEKEVFIPFVFLFEDEENEARGEIGVEGKICSIQKKQENCHPFSYKEEILIPNTKPFASKMDLWMKAMTRFVPRKGAKKDVRFYEEKGKIFVLSNWEVPVKKMEIYFLKKGEELPFKAPLLTSKFQGKESLISVRKPFLDIDKIILVSDKYAYEVDDFKAFSSSTKLEMKKEKAPSFNWAIFLLAGGTLLLGGSLLFLLIQKYILKKKA